MARRRKILARNSSRFELGRMSLRMRGAKSRAKVAPRCRNSAVECAKAGPRRCRISRPDCVFEHVV